MKSDQEKSLKSHLRKIAQRRGVAPAIQLTEIIFERFLVRLSRSQYSDRFILKGGMLLSRYIPLDRFTQDLDFSMQNMGQTLPELEANLVEIISIDTGDGFEYRDLCLSRMGNATTPDSVFRATMMGYYGRIRDKLTVDVGLADRVTPVLCRLPLMRKESGPLFEESVELSCYPEENIFAEKLEAIVSRGSLNSRMKDYHDLIALIRQSQRCPWPGLSEIVRSVFDSRGTDLRLPIAFDGFQAAAMQARWAPYLARLSMQHNLPVEFVDAVAFLNHWLSENTDLCHVTAAPKAHR